MKILRVVGVEEEEEVARQRARRMARIWHVSMVSCFGVRKVTLRSEILSAREENV